VGTDSGVVSLTRNDTKRINKRTNRINVANNRESAVDIVLSAALVVIHSLGASEGSNSGRSGGNERIIVRHFKNLVVIGFGGRL
jgi:hypothetical protein